MTTASSSYLAAVEGRRSNYALSPKSPISDEAIQKIVEHAVKYTPSAFNSQSARVVLVLGEKHRQLWDVIFEAYKKTLNGNVEREERTRKKFEDAYKSGYGSVVFFEDQERIKQYSSKSPDFATLFPIWSQNSTGIAQHVVWTALSAEGLGANLQHYGQVDSDIEASIRRSLDAPETWTSTAIMPFGTPIGPAGGAYPKTFEPIEDRVKVIKS